MAIYPAIQGASCQEVFRGVGIHQKDLMRDARRRAVLAASRMTKRGEVQRFELTVESLYLL
jgi:hypothetical protein